MKHTKFISFLLMILFLTVVPALLAQHENQPPKQSIRYLIKALSTLGGTQGGANTVTDNGLVMGWANLPGDQTEHGVLWHGRTMTDLGTLGGPNSASSFPVKDDKGIIAGNSQTSETDPFGENFCTFSTYSTFLCQGFRWQDGKMIALPTLGGNNSWATVVNRRGEVAGFAENNTRDPTCIAPQVDIRAVVWGPNDSDINEFPPLPGDTASAAFGINDHGQVVGASGICGTPSGTDAVHAVLWQHGKVTDLGSLGGLMNNVATFINNRGEVVGGSDLAGDATGHAFLWTEGTGMQDLGTLPEDFLSSAESINEEDQVVGESCDQNGNCRGFIWQNGVMTDLNSLVLPGSSLYLVNISDINNRGEVAGYAYDPNTGEAPGFVAIPCDAHHADVEDCVGHADRTSAAADETGTRPKMTLPKSVRQLLQRRMPFQRH